MMFAVIDCGTTNTRVYIADPTGRIWGQAAEKVGVRDVAVAGSNAVLKEGLCRAFSNAVAATGQTDMKIDYAIASGMITSEIGLIELVHTTAPVGIAELARTVEVVNDFAVTALNLPVVFVRGVKNLEGVDAPLSALRQLDFMRGEEVQMMGLIKVLRPVLPLTVVVLSSHTKMIHLDEAGRICGSMTTVSGGIYESLTGTLIAKNLRAGEEDPEVRYTREEILQAAADGVKHAGFLRTMLMPRFMQVLMKTNVEERRLFVEAAIAAEDLAIFDEFPVKVKANKAGYLLLGQEDRCRLYYDVLRSKFGKDIPINMISDPEQIASFTVQGAVAIAVELEKLRQDTKGIKI